jgi:hypothetical protein
MDRQPYQSANCQPTIGRRSELVENVETNSFDSADNKLSKDGVEGAHDKIAVLKWVASHHSLKVPFLNFVTSSQNNH